MNKGLTTSVGVGVAALVLAPLSWGPFSCRFCHMRRSFGADYLHGGERAGGGGAILRCGTDLEALAGIYSVPTIPCSERACERNNASAAAGLGMAIEQPLYDDVIHTRAYCTVQR